jgi:hypothetical protein
MLRFVSQGSQESFGGDEEIGVDFQRRRPGSPSH